MNNMTQNIHSAQPVSGNDDAVTTHAQLTATWCVIDEATQKHTSELYWRWRKIFEHDQSARIIEHPDYVLADVDATENRSGHLCFCSQGENDIAAAVLMPKTIDTRNAGGIGISWKLHGYRLVGDRILGDQHVEILNLLVKSVAMKMQSRSDSDFLLIEDLEENSNLWNAIHGTAATGCQTFSPTNIQQRFSIQLPASAEEYWKSFPSKKRYNLRRERKIFHNAGHVTLHSYTTVESVADFLAQAHQVSLNTWQTRQLGLRIGNDEQELKLFTFLAEQGAFRSFVLSLDDKPVAFVVGNQYNGTYHYEEVGYDADYAKLSPGQVLLGMVIDELYTQTTPTCFDFGLGDAKYKKMMSNQQTCSGTVWLVPSRFKVKATLAWLKLCLFLRRTAKQILKSTGLFRRMKQLLRKTASRQQGGK